MPGVDPIGQPLRVGPVDQPPYTIVGVVGDVRQVSLALHDAEAVYVPAVQWHFADRVRSFVIRTANAVDPNFLNAIRQAIWSIDGNRPIVRVASMNAILAASVAERRFSLILFEIFTLTSLVLAAAGIYGVLAGGVTERTPEIGVRAAIGASSWSIVNLVIRQGLLLTGVGVVVGVATTLVVTRLMVGMLFGVSRLDPTTYIGAISVLIVVAASASFLPALRAVRVDPTTALRME